MKKPGLSAIGNLLPDWNARFAFLALTIFAAASFGNYFGVCYIWNSSFSRDERLLVGIGSGLMFSQPVLLAIWWSMSSSSTVIRSIYCFSFLFLTFCSFMITMNHLNENGLPIPFISFSLTAVAIFACNALVLTIWSRVTGFRISARSLDAGGVKNSQFNLKQLFAILTLASVFCLLATMLLPEQDVMNNPAMPWPPVWPPMVTSILSFIFCMCIGSTLCVAAVFSNSRAIAYVTLLFLLFGPPSLCYFLFHSNAAAIFGPTSTSLSSLQIVALTYVVSFAFHAALLIVLICTRCLGFKMISSGKRSPPRQAVAG